MKEIIYNENCSGFYWRCVCGNSSSNKEKIRHMAQCLAEENDLILVIGPEVIEEAQSLISAGNEKSLIYGLPLAAEKIKNLFQALFK